DVGGVALNRVDRDDEPVGDLLSGAAGRDQAEHLDLTSAQAVWERRSRAAGRRSGGLAVWRRRDGKLGRIAHDLIQGQAAPSPLRGGERFVTYRLSGRVQGGGGDRLDQRGWMVAHRLAERGDGARKAGGALGLPDVGRQGGAEDDQTGRVPA